MEHSKVLEDIEIDSMLFLDPVFGALEKNISLKVLSISDTDLTFDQVTLLSSTKLVELNLDWCKLDDEGSCELADMLQVNTTLKKLNLRFTSILSIKAVSAITRSLHSNRTLKSLEFEISEEVLDEGTSELERMQAVNQSLETVHVSGGGASGIAQGLMMNVTLRNLKLSSIDCIGASELTRALKVNQTLITLDISSNDVGDTGASELARTLKKNQTLIILDMSWNHACG